METFLSSNLVLATKDPAQAESLLAHTAIPYQSEAMSQRTPFSTQVYVAKSSRVHVSYVRTAGLTEVHACTPDDSYVLVMGMKNQVDIAVGTGGTPVAVNAEVSLVQSPLQPSQVRTPEYFENLFLRFDRDHLTKELANMMGRPVSAPLVFQPSFDMTTEAGQRFRNLAIRFCRELSKPEQTYQKLTIPVLEDGLSSLLLNAQRHNYTRLLSRYSQAGPWQVRIAEEYMLANAHLPISLGDICAAAGICSRTLQHSFQKMRGCTPMTFLKQLRMNQVRASLLRGDENTTVTAAAAQWGFLHFGRFAVDYHVFFGEKPSETLRNARKRLPSTISNT